MAAALQSDNEKGLVGLRRHTDLIRLNSGQLLTLRFAEPEDAEALQDYFRRLSAQSRYSRFLGGISELPRVELDHFVHAGELDRFSILATTATKAGDSNVSETIVGEARYGVEATSGKLEFGLSVADGWQGLGVGRVLLSNMECRAAASGAEAVFGETLRTNTAMIALARKSGYRFSSLPVDGRLVLFEKALEAPAMPCVTARLAAEGLVLSALHSRAI